MSFHSPLWFDRRQLRGCHLAVVDDLLVLELLQQFQQGSGRERQR